MALGLVTASLPAAGLISCAADASTPTSERPVTVAKATGLRLGDLPGFRVQPNVTVTVRPARRPAGGAHDVAAGGRSGLGRDPADPRGGALAAGAVEHIDAISFTDGVVVVTLQTSSVDGPFPAALERSLSRHWPPERRAADRGSPGDGSRTRAGSVSSDRSFTMADPCPPFAPRATAPR